MVSNFVSSDDISFHPRLPRVNDFRTSRMFRIIQNQQNVLQNSTQESIGQMRARKSQYETAQSLITVGAETVISV